MKARIYQPSKKTTQSGFGRTKSWVLEYEPQTARVPEPLMGWIASGDTLNQVRIPFADKDSAVDFCERNGIPYQVFERHERRPRPRNYLQNWGMAMPESKK